MDKGTFDKLIASPVDITTQEVSQLEDLLASFPYCQVAHLLLAKESHDKKSMLYPQKLRKASTYALDRRVLYNVINRRTIQEKVVVHAPVVAAPIPEKKTAYESLPKSANNQNSSFLRELEDNLKLLKQQKKNHDFSAVAFPTQIKEEKISVTDRKETDKEPIAESLLLPSTLEPEIPKVPEHSTKVTESNPLLDISPEKEGKTVSVVQVLEETTPTALELEVPNDLEDSVKVMETSSLLDTAPEEEEKIESVVQALEIASSASLEQPIDTASTKEKNILLDYLPVFHSTDKGVISDIEERNEEAIVDTSQDNQYQEKIIKDSFESQSSSIIDVDPIVIEAQQVVSNSDYSESENNTLFIPISSIAESILPADNLEDSMEKTITEDAKEGIDLLPDPEPLSSVHPLVNSLDLPSVMIMETKLGSELSFEAPSGTEEIELFLAYLRKNAPLKAPVEVQSKIIEKFIETKPTITRYPNVNFGQDNEDLAKSSISLRTELVTENYANILVKQNNIAKAIEVYKKLILKNPDKSAYFAAKLYELQSR